MKILIDLESVKVLGLSVKALDGLFLSESVSIGFWALPKHIEI
jgi:hypothetical protein